MRFVFLFLLLPALAFSQCVPNDWAGSYTGNMQIFGNNGLQQTIGVHLDLLPIDYSGIWSYNMSYVNLKNDEVVSTKAYKIVCSEQDKNCWMDEGDSLLIEMSLLDNCFYDHFELNEMFFNSSLCKEGDDLLFMITGGKKKPTFTSPFIDGAGGVVESMHVSFLQRVRLIKITP